MRILLAILLLTAATIRSQAAHAFFNFSDAIGVTTNCTVTIAPDRVYTDGTDQIVLPETLTYKGITNGSLTVSNIYAAGTNLIYVVKFVTARTNASFYFYAPVTNGLFNTWAFRVLKPNESPIGYTRGQVDALIVAATNGITGGSGNGAWSASNSATPLKIVGSGSANVSSNAGIYTVSVTNSDGLNTNAVIGIATNGTLPGLTVGGTAGLPGAIWFSSSVNSNYGTWLQGPSTGTNGYIALPGTAGDGYLKATRDTNGIAVLTYDTPPGASTNFDGLVITNKILYPLSGVWVGASGSEKVGFYDPVADELTSFQSNGIWHADSIIAGALNSASVLAGGTNLHTLAATGANTTNFNGIVVTNKILYPSSGVWVGAIGNEKVGFYDPVADDLTSFQSNGVWHTESIISGAVSSASFSGNGAGVTNVPITVGTNLSLRIAGGTNYFDVTGQLNNWQNYSTNVWNTRQGGDPKLSNIVGLASSLFTNVPAAGTNLSLRTAGGTNFFDVTGQLNNWQSYSTNVWNTRQGGSATLTNLAGTGAITNAPWTNSYQAASATLTNLAGTGAFTNVSQLTNVSLRYLQSIRPGWNTNTVIDLTPTTCTNYWVIDVTNNITIRLTNFNSGSWFEATLLQTNAVVTNYSVTWILDSGVTRYWHGSTNSASSSNKCTTVNGNFPTTNIVKLVTSTSL